MHWLTILARGGVILCLVLALGGCAVPMRIPLKPEQRAGITELKAHAFVEQDRLIAAVQPSNASAVMGGGLIFALVDSAVTSTRIKASEDILAPLLATVKDVDYRREFDEIMRRALAGQPIKVAHATTRALAPDDAPLKRLRQDLQPGQALLLIRPRYFLSVDFRTLDTETTFSLWTAGGDDRVPAQRGVLYYQSQPLGPGGDASVALWSERGAAAFRQALRESIDETLGMVLLDMSQSSPPAGAPSESFAFNTDGRSGSVTGQVLRERPSRAIVLGTDQKIYSLPRTAPGLTAARRDG